MGSQETVIMDYEDFSDDDITAAETMSAHLFNMQERFPDISYKGVIVVTKNNLAKVLVDQGGSLTSVNWDEPEKPGDAIPADIEEQSLRAALLAHNLNVPAGIISAENLAVTNMATILALGLSIYKEGLISYEDRVEG